MVKQAARFTVKEIPDSVDVSSGTVHKILTQELKLRAVCARRVPHLLAKEQMTNRVKWRKISWKKNTKIVTNLDFRSRLQVKNLGILF